MYHDNCKHSPHYEDCEKCEKNTLQQKIIKKCGVPADFCFEYIDGASEQSDIRRMKEYCACVRKVEKENKN